MKTKMKEIVNSLSVALKGFNLVIISFGIFFIGCVWINLYHQINNEKQIAVDSAIKETANLSRAFEEHMSRTINSTDQAVLFLKYQYEIEGSSINIPRYIQEGRFANLPFVLMGIIDENGDFVVSSQVPFVPANLKDREHFQVHTDFDSGNLFVSKSVLGRSSGKWSIQFTRRINKADGTFGGVVVVSLDPFYFTEFYKQVDLGKNSSVTIVGKDGFLRARLSGDNVYVGQDLNNTVLMKRLQDSTEGYYIADSKVDGIERIYSYRALKNYPLAVAVGMDKEVVLQSLYQRMVGYYGAAILITLVTLVFIFIVIRNAIRQYLAKLLLRQAHDELETQVQMRTRELYAVNNMLAAANEELQKANGDLEEEIKERRQIEDVLLQKNEVIQKMAYTDSLTKLPNRAYLKKELELEMLKARKGEASGSLLFIDIDDLKSVNDVFGHTLGDNIIVMAGTRIAEMVGQVALVSRIGGDEFIVLLPGEIDRNRVSAIADRIIKALEAKHEAGGDVFHMSASIGIALYPADGDTAEEILKNADCAMYAAKKNAKKCWRFYDAAMQQEVTEKIILTNRLRYAIESRELELFYQPQVDAKTGSITGFEALLRWHSLELGAIPPTRFIPIAEQSGLIIPIGNWVMHQACQFARLLSEKGLADLYVAVNISPLQLAANDFITLVQEAIHGAGISPAQLELEITESVLIASVAESIKTLKQIHDMGVRIALDDFGTGYSSLTYLRKLPVGTVKLDKSFIDIIFKEKVQAQLISSIIHMAHIFPMKVIAEGVETEAQMAYLRDNDCDGIQGYLISPPVSEKKALALLKSKVLE